jgi:hypothetical protein
MQDELETVNPIQVKEIKWERNNQGNLNAWIKGDQAMALDQWNQLLKQYDAIASPGFPSGFNKTLPDGTIVKGSFYFGGNSNPTGYNIKVVTTNPMVPRIPENFYRFKE